ncbi:MAG: hypothetical protein ACPGXK_15550, partial [Phycisphaerae bacterium]
QHRLVLVKHGSIVDLPRGHHHHAPRFLGKVRADAAPIPALRVPMTSDYSIVDFMTSEADRPAIASSTVFCADVDSLPSELGTNQYR